MTDPHVRRREIVPGAALAAAVWAVYSKPLPPRAPMRPGHGSVRKMPSTTREVGSIR